MARQHFGGFPNNNMQQMMKQVQKMQQQMQDAQSQLEEETFTAAAGGGMVTLSMNGRREVLSVEIKPECLDPDDVEMLQDMVKAAVNDCLKKIDEASEASMGRIAPGLGGMGLGGLF